MIIPSNTMSHGVRGASERACLLLPQQKTHQGQHANQQVGAILRSKAVAKHGHYVTTQAIPCGHLSHLGPL